MNIFDKISTKTTEKIQFNCLAQTNEETCPFSGHPHFAGVPGVVLVPLLVDVLTSS